MLIITPTCSINVRGGLKMLPTCNLGRNMLMLLCNRIPLYPIVFNTGSRNITGGWSVVFSDDDVVNGKCKKVMRIVNTCLHLLLKFLK